MNVIKDVVFEGTILRMIQGCIEYLDTQIKEKTYLGSDGLFVTEEEYPKFVRQKIRLLKKIIRLFKTKS